MERRVNIARCFPTTLFWPHLHGRIATCRRPKGNKWASPSLGHMYVGMCIKEYAALCCAACSVSVFLIKGNGPLGEWPFYLASNDTGQDCRRSLCVRKMDMWGSVEEQNR